MTEATLPAPAGAVEEHPAVEVDSRTRFEILGAIMLGLFLAALDQTIVGPILPRVVGDLHGADLYTWVVTSYLLTSTVTVPIYGKLSDLFGRKPMLIIGISLFLVGSILSGLSQEMWQLIAFRGIQGLGAGSLFPIALAVIGDLFTPAERGKYQGLFGAVFGIAFLVGPGLGGLLTDSFSWHWVFFVNVPIGLVALFVIGRLLPTVRRPGATRNIDYLGVATFTAGLVPILIGLTNAQAGDWGSPGVWGLIALGVAFLVAFVFVESRAPEPMIPLNLFRIPSFALSMVAVFTAMFGFFSAVVFLPLWFQVVRGSSATASGYNLLPFLFGLILSSIVSGQVVSRTGRYKWLVVGSLVLATVGLILFTNLRADTPSPVLWFWMAVMGIGIGPTMAVFTIIVQNAVPFTKLGAATADLTLFRQVGGTVGLTFGFTLFRSFLTTDLLKEQFSAAGVPAQVVTAIPSGGSFGGDVAQVGGADPVQQFLAQAPAQVQPVLQQYLANFEAGFHQAFSIALATSLWLGVGAMVLGVLATFFLRELPLRRTHGASQEAPQGSEPVPMVALE